MSKIKSRAVISKNMRNKNQKPKSAKDFWDEEYQNKKHLTLSDEPSDDLIKFSRFVERQEGRKQLNQLSSVLDLGCGNGRNLIYLSKTFGARGVGYDISSEAIRFAKKNSVGLPIFFGVKSIASDLSLPDKSQNFVLDMMASHFLNSDERISLIQEIARVLKSRGWFFWKTFLLEDDGHARRLLRDHPGSETGSYIHPKMNVAEHVFTETEILDLLKNHFVIHKMIKSQRHRQDGKAFKRRSIAVYAERI